MAERIKTGIEGMDDLMAGGFLKSSLVLLTGTAGTGKTAYGCQYIWNGAKLGETGLYVSLEEPIENIKTNALNFGWDFEKLEKDKKVLFVRYDPFHAEDVYDLIESSAKKIGAQRVVIDSVSALGLYIRDAAELRRTIFNLSMLLRKLKCTSLILSEILPEQKSLSRFGVEEFVTDGVVVLYYTRTDSQFARSVTVWKMRGTDHSQRIHPYKIIAKQGIVIYPKEETFVKLG